MRRIAGLAGAAMALAHSNAAQATEAALGRTVLGTQLQLRPGVTAPIQLTAISLNSFYLEGDIQTTREVPFAGLVTAGAVARVSFTPITLVHS